MVITFVSPFMIWLNTSFTSCIGLSVSATVEIIAIHYPSAHTSTVSSKIKTKTSCLRFSCIPGNIICPLFYFIGFSPSKMTIFL